MLNLRTKDENKQTVNCRWHFVCIILPIKVDLHFPTSSNWVFQRNLSPHLSSTIGRLIIPLQCYHTLEQLKSLHHYGTNVDFQRWVLTDKQE
jgi:hypothetical protein